MFEIDPEAVARLGAEDRESLRLRLEELESLAAENPLVFYNHPLAKKQHPRQTAFHSSRKPLRAFLGGNRCLAGWMHVRMADGSTKAIEDIQVGEMVLGADLEGHTRPARVLNVFENGARDVWQFRFGKRESEVGVVATEDHQILCRHEKHRASRVEPLSVLAFPRSRSRWSAQRAVDWNLNAGGVDEEFATIFGLLAGDGHVKGERALFYNEDPDVVALMERELEPYGLRLAQNSARPVQYAISRSKTLVPATGGVLAPKRAFVSTLRKHGLDRLAHDKDFSDLWDDWSQDAMARLIAGLLLTDGSVWEASEGWRVGFTSVSRSLAEGVRLGLESFGVYGSRLLVQERSGKRPEYSFTIGNYESLRRLYDAIPLVGRKRDKLCAALEGWEGKRSDGARLCYRGAEYVGERETYDLLVDHPDHLFVLHNGLIVSNSGKTTAGIVDDLIQAIDLAAVPAHLRGFKRFKPPFYCRVVIPDLGNSLEGVSLQKIREWCPRSQLLGGTMEKAWEKSLRVLRFKNGSWVQFMSNDQDLDKFGGAALHRTHYDEEPREDIRTECLYRLVDYDGDEVLTMTPLQGMSWTFNEVYEPWEKATDAGGELEDVDVFLVDMDDNPHLSDQGKRRALAGSKTSEEREARKTGRFVHFAGLIYPEFSSAHVVPESPVPGTSKEDRKAGVPVPSITVGIDPGWRHLAAVVWTYLEPDGRMVVFDELALAASTIREVADHIQLVNAKHRIQPDTYVIDPASRNKNNQTGRSDQLAFADHGIYAIPGQNSWRTGIDSVKQRLQASPPALVVQAHCTGLRDEFRKYRWASQTRTENASKEGPVKAGDDELDALRYVCMHRQYRPPVEARTDGSRLDRMLEAQLERLGRGHRVTHPMGPGIYS